jgi:hypothetical protein
VRCVLHRHFCVRTHLHKPAHAHLRPASPPPCLFHHKLLSLFWGSPGENIFFLTFLLFVRPFADLSGDLNHHSITALRAMRVSDGSIGIPRETQHHHHTPKHEESTQYIVFHHFTHVPSRSFDSQCSDQPRLQLCQVDQRSA